MDSLAFARYLADAIPAPTRLVLQWPDASEIEDEADVGPYAIIIDRTLRQLGIDDPAKGDDNALKAIGDWQAWEAIARNVALDYDESQGDRNTSLSQMHKQARIEANRAHTDAMPYLPIGQIQRIVPRRKPRRFSESSLTMRRKASRKWSDA